MIPKAVDNSPARNIQRPSIVQKVSISSFQKNEALVLTDNSNRYAQWPRFPDRKSLYQHKPPIVRTVRHTQNHNGNNSSNIRGNYINHRRDAKESTTTNQLSIRESLSTLKAKSTRSPKPLLVVQGEPEVKSIEENKSNEIPENHYGSLIHDPPVRSINSSNSPALPAENEKNPFAINSILSRAEGLLSRVKGATASMPPAIPIRQALPSTVSAEVPQKVRTALLANPDHDSAQIDWLIRGVTEAYDAEPEYDDDVIRHLIKTGGDPPSQLSFPSLYATNQKVMSELSAVRKLRIQLQVFQCYSSKFGLRKKGSYLLFRLPVGCKVADDQPRQLLLPLPELDNGDNYSSSKSAKRYTDKSDHLKVFFVGSVECRKDVSVDLLLTDQVMQCWLSGKEEGVLRIELYSYVSILKTSLAGKTTEPVLFGSANIPLNGLLCNENLDTLCRIDMDADLDTMAVVANRLTALRIPPLQRVAHAIDSSKIATLTARLSLVSHLVPIPVGSPTVLTYPVTNEEVGQIDQVGDPLDTALHYVPSEEGKDNGEFSSVEFFEDLRSNPRHLKLEVVNQKIQQSVTHNSVIGAHYGIAFHCITGIKLPVEFWVDKMSTIINGKLIPFISLDYKLSTNTKDHIERRIKLDAPVVALLSLALGKIYSVKNVAKWVAPVIEAWVILKDAESSEIVGKKLLGLCRFNGNCCVHDVVGVEIIDLKSKVCRGNIRCSLHLGESLDEVEAFINRSLGSIALEKALETRGEAIGPVKETVANELEQPNAELSLPKKSEEPIKSTALYKSMLRLCDRHPSPSEKLIVDAKSGEADSSALNDNSIDDLLSMLNPKHQVVIENLIDPPDSGKQYVEPSYPTVVEIVEIDEEVWEKQNKNEVHLEISSSVDLRVSRNESGKKEPVKEQHLTALTSSLSSYHPRDGIDSCRICILDVAIEGVFSLLPDGATDLQEPAQILGGYVTYELPGLEREDVLRVNEDINQTILPSSLDSSRNSTIQPKYLWWDAECAVLNGRQRHRFLYNPELDNISQVMGPSREVLFTVYASDFDGSLPSDPVLLATTILPKETLSELLSGSGGVKVIDLSLEIADRFLELLPLDAKLSVSLSYRQEPILLRQSDEFGRKRAEVISSITIIDTEKEDKIPVENKDPWEDLPEELKFESIDFDTFFNSSVDKSIANSSQQDLIRGKSPVTEIPSNRNNDIDLVCTIGELIHLNAGSLVANCKLYCAIGVDTGDGVEGLPSSTRESVIAFSSFRPLTPKIVWSESISVQLRPHNASMHEIKAFKNSVLQVCLYCREPSIANNQREDVAVLGRPEMIRLSDHRIGTAVVDLTTLSLGIDLLDGYYHIYDSAQRMIGQIRVSINYEIYQQRAVASSMKSTAASVKLLANESDRNLDLDLDSCSDFSSIDFLREKMKELDLIRAHLLNFSSNATVDTIGAKPTGSRQLASSPHNFMLDGESVGDNRQIGDDDDDREMVFNLNSSQRSSGNTLFSREDEDLAHPMHTIEMDYSNEFNEKDMYESDFESLSDEQSDSELFPDRQSPDLEINSEEFTIALNNNITDEEAEVNPDFEFKEIRIEMTDEVTKLSNVENSMTLSDNNNYNNFSDFQNDSLEHCSKPDAGREIEDEVGQRDGGTKEQYQDQVQLEIIECEPIADVSGNVSKENLEEEEEVENIYHGRSDCKESERMLEPCPQKVEKKDEVIDAIEDTKRMTGSEEEAKQTLVSLEDDSSLSVTSRQDINPKESFEQNTQQNSFNEIDHNANRIDESSLSTESAQSIESVRKLLREEMRKMLDEEGSYAHMKFGESSSEVSMAVRSSSSGSPGRAVEKAIQLSKFLPCSSPQDEIISASDIMSSPSFNISVYDFPLTKKSATIPTPVHSGMAKDSEDILRDSFSRIESHLPNISIDRGKQGRTSKEFPWKTIKNNFLDDETDRISKIMLGIFTREQVKR